MSEGITKNRATFEVLNNVCALLAALGQRSLGHDAHIYVSRYELEEHINRLAESMGELERIMYKEDNPEETP